MAELGGGSPSYPHLLHIVVPVARSSEEHSPGSQPKMESLHAAMEGNRMEFLLDVVDKYCIVPSIAVRLLDFLQISFLVPTPFPGLICQCKVSSPGRNSRAVLLVCWSPLLCCTSETPRRLTRCALQPCPFPMFV